MPSPLFYQNFLTKIKFTSQLLLSSKPSCFQVRIYGRKSTYMRQNILKCLHKDERRKAILTTSSYIDYIFETQWSLKNKLLLICHLDPLRTKSIVDHDARHDIDFKSVSNTLHPHFAKQLRIRRRTPSATSKNHSSVCGKNSLQAETRSSGNAWVGCTLW